MGKQNRSGYCCLSSLLNWKRLVWLIRYQGTWRPTDIAQFSLDTIKLSLQYLWWHSKSVFGASLTWRPPTDPLRFPIFNIGEPGAERLLFYPRCCATTPHMTLKTRLPVAWIGSLRLVSKVFGPPIVLEPGEWKIPVESSHVSQSIIPQVIS